MTTSENNPLGNILFADENMKAMQWLLPEYRNKVRCIYIDPPYNTRRAFRSFSDNMSHSGWLDFMSERLKVMRQFLNDDGSIWVSVDDSEGHYLKVLMDQIFGKANFVANIVWERTYTARISKIFNTRHEYVLVYARNKSVWSPNKCKDTSSKDSKYKNPDNHPKGDWYPMALDASFKTRQKEGDKFVHTFRNGIKWSPGRNRYSLYSNSKLEELENKREIWFGKTLENIPKQKIFLSDSLKKGRPYSTIWPWAEVGHTHEAKKDLYKAFGNSNFDTPKPERPLKRIISIATNPEDLVMDCFLGSGTTAAVALKMGRKFIGIEQGEQAVKLCLPRIERAAHEKVGMVS